MLIQLLEYLQSGKTYSVQQLAELLHKDVGSIQVELEYLENQGYIRKVAYQADCNHNCNGCHGCDQPTPAAPDVNKSYSYQLCAIEYDGSFSEQPPLHFVFHL